MGWEIDYARTPGNASPSRPRIDTFGASLLVQLPVNPQRLQAYGAVGGGIYQQEFGNRDNAGGHATALGGGIKVTLSQSPDESLKRLSFKHPQRVTVGLGLAF